jgi:hypothetical protein
MLLFYISAQQQIQSVSKSKEGKKLRRNEILAVPSQQKISVERGRKEESKEHKKE